MQGGRSILSKPFPSTGDIHWDDADDVLGQAQIVLMSGLTVVNETLPAVIRRTPIRPGLRDDGTDCPAKSCAL